MVGSDAWPGEGWAESPIMASSGPAGDELPPSRENRIFAILASKLSGTVSAAFGWTPDQFWNATPAELTVIFTAFTDGDPGSPGTTPLDINQLEKLKETFPDG